MNRTPHFVKSCFVLVVGLAATELAATGSAAGFADEPRADFVLHARRIWTGDEARPWAESLAARGGVIVAVGDRADVDKLRGPKTRVLDLPGSFATPGLIDSHGHLSSLGQTIESVDLRDVTSIEEVVRRVVERAKALPAGEWVLGQSWDQSWDTSVPERLP